MVNVSLVRHLAASLTRSSGKSGWGPYRNVRKGEHFVGTEPHPLKYHVVSLRFMSNSESISLHFKAFRILLILNWIMLPSYIL